jgi:hypothetical protein
MPKQRNSPKILRGKTTEGRTPTDMELLNIDEGVETYKDQSGGVVKRRNTKNFDPVESKAKRKYWM